LEGTPEVEVGYAIRFELWGRGFATEITKAVISLALGPIELKSVVAVIDAANVPSRRVAEKAGLTYERAVVYDGDPGQLYRIRSTS
jgi:RimJ/RimL family protein N-acetyltransferase